MEFLFYDSTFHRFWQVVFHKEESFFANLYPDHKILEDSFFVSVNPELGT